MVVFRGKSRVQPPCCHLGSSNQYCMTHFSMRLALQRDARGVCGVPYLLLYVRACGLSPKHGIAALFKALHSRIKWTCVWSCKLIIFMWFFFESLVGHWSSSIADMFLKYFSPFAAVKIGKKKCASSFVSKWWCTLFANFYCSERRKVL